MTEDFKHHHHTFDALIHRIIGLRWTQIHRCTNPDHKPDCACAGTTTAWHPSMYTQIRDDVYGMSGEAMRGVSESRPPLWVDGIDWINTADTLAQEWAPAITGGTVARLDGLTRHAFGPDDTGWLQNANQRLTRLATDGDTLLQGEEHHRLDVVAPCPQCHQTTVYRKDSGGDMVRKTALQLTVNGCRCVACGAFWDREHLNFLAEVIGCQHTDTAARVGTRHVRPIG